MAEAGARAFAAARAMVGVRFRPQGCDPAAGLDCVGLVWAAYAAAGVRLVRPRAYPLRGWSEARIVGAVDGSGLVSTQAAARVGDVALIALAAGQFHLGVLGTERIVHAHAGLRRVVETPLEAAVLTARRWRFVES